MEEIKELTYGEKMVGIDFNPANDPQVQSIKALCAQLIDLLNKEIVCQEKNGKARVDKILLLEEAVRQAVSAQMWAVKGITYKY